MKNLIYAARPLVSDFFSTLVYVALLALHVDVRLAIAGAMVVGVGQVIVMRLRGQPIPTLQWAALGLVVVFGGVSILTQDPRYLMAKPSIIYPAIAVVMLKPGWMNRYMPPDGVGLAEDLMFVFGYVWAGLMALTAVANLIVAVWFTPDWPLFAAVFPLASKVALFAVQFTIVRAVARRRHFARSALAAQPA
jgi:intracellular septation protein A